MAVFQDMLDYYPGTFGRYSLQSVDELLGKVLVHRWVVSVRM